MPIKAYSPELIVHPILAGGHAVTGATEDSAASESAMRERWHPLLSRADAVVVGPGLGRDPATYKDVELIVAVTQGMNKPLVLDGDALSLLAQKPTLLAGHPAAIITPNGAEFARLCAAFGIDDTSGGGLEGAVQLLASKLPGVVVVRKGPVDVVALAPRRWARASSSEATLSAAVDAATAATAATSDASTAATHTGVRSFVVTESGSPRRCGGQGDLVAGTIATFAAWVFNAARAHDAPAPPMSPAAGTHVDSLSLTSSVPRPTAAGAGAGGSTPARPRSTTPPPPDRAAVLDRLAAGSIAASRVVRHAAARAFAKHHRSTTSPEILAEIGPAFYELFDKA